MFVLQTLPPQSFDPNYPHPSQTDLTTEANGKTVGGGGVNARFDTKCAQLSKYVLPIFSSLELTSNRDHAP